MTDPDTGDTVSVMPAPERRCSPEAACSSPPSSTITWACSIQWTYDNLATTADGTPRRSQQHRQHRHPRGVQVRARERGDSGVDRRGDAQQQSDDVGSVEQHAGMGLPFTTSPLAPTPAAATLIDGGLAQQVAGLGAYAFWQKRST